jgi:hypothetical protein
VGSLHGAPGTTHAWKEHTDPAAQQASPHASVASQQTLPAQMPPSPHGSPVEQGTLWSRNDAPVLPPPPEPVVPASFAPPVPVVVPGPPPPVVDVVATWPLPPQEAAASGASAAPVIKQKPRDKERRARMEP